MDIQTLKILFGVNYAATVMISYAHKWLTKSAIIKLRKEKEDLPFLLLALLIMRVLPLVWIFTSLFDFANIELSSAVNVMGLFFLLLSGILFFIAHYQLGKNWSLSLTIKEKQTLNTTGLYRFVRHPMYASIFLSCLSYFPATTNLLIGTLPLLAFIILYLTRVKKEEQLMIDEYGDAYLKYMERTPRIIPRLNFR